MPPAGLFTPYGFAALIDASVPGPGLCISGSAGTQAEIGTSSQASITVTNCGNAPLTISNVQLSTSTVFALPSQSGCVGSLAAGASCTETISFTPVAAGTVSGTVTVTSNALQTNYAIIVSGFGTVPSISLPQSTITFPAQVLGNNSSGFPGQAVILNVGTAPLIVDTAKTTITGDFGIVANSCSSPIPPNPPQTFGCAFEIVFTPTALGTRTGTLTVASNDPLHPTVAVSLTGTAIAAYTAPTITGLSTPSVAIGSTAAKLTVFGTNFFPGSYVVIGGEAHRPTSFGSTSLSVTIDPSLLTVMGELPVSVVNPAPGGQSSPLNLVVYQALPISAAAWSTTR